MQFTAFDIHKVHINGCIRNDAGEIVFEQRFQNDVGPFDKFLKRVQEDDMIVLESCVCWEHIYDYLCDKGYSNVVLANPCQISKDKKKTDKLDARKLSKLAQVNMLPTSYAAPKDIRDQRYITRLKASLTQLRTQVKNKIHAVLLQTGNSYDGSDVFGKAGIEYLRSLDLEMRHRIPTDKYIELIEKMNELIDGTQDVIEDFAQYNYNIKILMTHPGISYYLASMIDAEIGDIRRFKNIARLTSYAGLNPRVSQSGLKCHIGHISKQGSVHLRWALVQAAHVAVMRDKKYAKIFHKISKRRNPNIAYVAVARRILKTIYPMLKNNAYYLPQLEERKAS